MEYGAGKPEVVLELFRQPEIRQAFEEYLLTHRQAGQEAFGFDEELGTFHLHSDNLRVWHTVVDELVASFAPRSVRIFWNRNWAMTSNHPEVPDGMEEELSQPLGLDDYFTNRLPCVTPDQAEIAIAEIRSWQLSASTE